MDWLEQGSPDKPAVIFLHGFPDVAETWFPLTEFLKNDFYCVCPEILPASQSGGSKGIEARSLEILNLLRTLNIEKFHLVGHDMGAPLAWSVAELTSLRCLSLTMMSGMSVRQMVKRLKRVPRQRKMSWYFPLMQIPGLPEIAVKYFRPQIDRLIHKKGAHPLRVTKEGLSRFGLYREYARGIGSKRNEKLQCPLFLLWGHRDPYVLPPQKDEFENSAAKVFTQIFDGGHWFFLEDPKGVAQCMKQLFQQ